MNKLHKLLSLIIVFAFIASLTLTQTVNATGWEAYDYWDIDTSDNFNPYSYNPSGTGWYLWEYEERYVDGGTALTDLYTPPVFDNDLWLLEWSMTETETYNDGSVGRVFGSAEIFGSHSIKYGYEWTGPGSAPGASIDFSYAKSFDIAMAFGISGGASGDYIIATCDAYVSPEFLAYESYPGETYYYDTRYGIASGSQNYGSSHSYSVTMPPAGNVFYSVNIYGIANLYVAWSVYVEDEINLDSGQEEFYLQATCDTENESVSRLQLQNGIEAQSYAYTETLTAVFADMEIE